MKKICLLMVSGSLLMSNQYLHAQVDSSGIYKTASDFQQKRLSYAINYKTEKHKIKNNILFNDSEIKVKHNGQTYTLDRNNTYGFKNTKGEVFRLVDKKEYRILNPGEPLLIYMYKHPSHSPKEVQKYPPMYYFSTDASAIPQDLTKANLKTAFPDNHRFHDALDAQFKNDNELYAYDSFHKMYKLSWIIKNNNN